MAEIRVERKRTSDVWPWVLGLAALILLVWALAEMPGHGRDAVVGPSAAVHVVPVAPVEAASAVAPAPRVVGAMPAVLHVPPPLDLLLDFPSA